MEHIITRQRLAWGLGTLFLVVIIIQVASHTRFLFNSSDVDSKDNIPIDQGITAAATTRHLHHSTLWSHLATLCTIYAFGLGYILYKRRARERRRLRGDISPDRIIDGWLSRTWRGRWRRWLNFEIRVFGVLISPGTILVAIGFVTIHVIQIAGNLLVVISIASTTTESQSVVAAAGAAGAAGALVDKIPADGSIKSDEVTYQQELGNRIAQLALVDIAVAVALSARHSILWRPFGFEWAVMWHTWFGRIGSLCALYHATLEIAIYYSQQSNSSLFEAMTRSPMATSGSGIILLVSILVFGSHPLVRSMSYRLFRLTHLLSFGGLVVLGILHHWAFLVFYTAVFGVWMVDQIQRWGVESRPVHLVSMEALPGKIVRLRLEPSYGVSTFIPGQFAYVSLAKSRISSWIFSHPFSISRIDNSPGKSSIRASATEVSISSSGGLPNHGNNFYLEPETMVVKTSTSRSVLTFHIKTSGRRTSGLYKLAQDTAGDDSHGLRFSVSKPLGFPLLSVAGHGFGDFETVVLIAQGIGITPWIAVLQYMQQTKVQTKELNLIWSVPSSDVLHAFMQELSSWEYSSDLVLNFDVHITREVADVEPGLLSDVIKIHHGRPDYGLVLETIRQRNSRTHVALGLCAADETVQKCGNQVRGATFSNEQSWWSICAERFEL